MIDGQTDSDMVVYIRNGKIKTSCSWHEAAKECDRGSLIVEVFVNTLAVWGIYGANCAISWRKTINL